MTRYGRAAWILTAAVMLAAATAPFLGCNRADAAQIEWIRKLPEATQKARLENKLVIVDLYTDWCGWCKEMDVKTWAQPAVIEQKNKYVFLKLNAETEPDGIALQKRFGVVSYPTVMLLDSSADEFERLQGFLPAQAFLERLRSALENPDSLRNMKKREAQEPENFSLRFRIGKDLLARYGYADAQARFEVILAKDPDNNSQIVDASMLYLALCQASQAQVEASLDTITNLSKKFPASKFVPGARLLSGEVLLRSGRKDAAKEQIEGFLKSYPDHPLAGKAKKLLSEL